MASYKNIVIGNYERELLISDNVIWFTTPEAYARFMNETRSGTRFVKGGKLTPLGIRLEKAYISRVGYDLVTDEFVCVGCELRSKCMHHLCTLHGDDCSSPINQMPKDLAKWRYAPSVDPGSLNLYTTIDGLYEMEDVKNLEKLIDDIERRAMAKFMKGTERPIEISNSKTGQKEERVKVEHSVVKRKMWVRKESVVDSIVDKIENPILVDEEVMDDSQGPPRWQRVQSVRRARVRLAERVTADVNNLMKDILALAIEAQIPFINLDGKQRDYYVRLKHVVDFKEYLRSGCDLDDYKLRELLLEDGVDTVLFNGKRISVHGIKPGHSGLVITKFNVPKTQHHLVEWSQNGVCVVQGRSKGIIMNVLEENARKGDIEMELYSAQDQTILHGKFETQYQTWLKNSFYDVVIKNAPEADHKSEDNGGAEDVKDALANFLSCFLFIPHMNCRKCLLRLETTTINQLKIAVKASKGFRALQENHGVLSKILFKILEQLVEIPIEVRTFGGWRPQVDLVDTRLQILDNHINELHNELIMIANLIQNHSQMASVDGNRVLKELQQTVRIRKDEDVNPIMSAMRELEARLAMKLKTEINLHSQAVIPRHMQLDNVCSFGYEVDFLKSIRNLDVMFQNCFQYLSQGIERVNFKNSVAYIHEEKGLRSAVQGFHRLDSMSSVNTLLKYDTIQQRYSEQCVIKRQGIVTLTCCKDDDGDVVNLPPIMPLLHNLRLAYLNSAIFIRVPDSAGSDVLVPKEGFCYVLQFLVMSSTINERDMQRFTVFTNQQIQRLGPWPVLSDLLLSIHAMVCAFPEVVETPPCVWVVDHPKRLIHVVSQLGVGQGGLHQLYFKNIGALYDIIQADLEGPMLNYQVGGNRQNEVRDAFGSLLDKRTFLEYFNSPEKLSSLLMTPSGVYGLSKLLVRHGFPQELMLKHELAIALVKLEKMGSDFGKIEVGTQMLQAFVHQMHLQRAWISHLVGSSEEDVYKHVDLLDASLKEMSSYSIMDSMDAIIEDTLKKEGELREYIDTLLAAQQLSYGTRMVRWFSNWRKRYQYVSASASRSHVESSSSSRREKISILRTKQYVMQLGLEKFLKLFKSCNRMIWFFWKCVDFYTFQLSYFLYSLFLWICAILLANSLFSIFMSLKNYFIKQAKRSRDNEEKISIFISLSQRNGREEYPHPYEPDEDEVKVNGVETLKPQASSIEKELSWWMAAVTLIMMFISTDWGMAACSILSKFRMLHGILLTTGMRAQASVNDDAIESVLDALEGTTLFDVDLTEIEPAPGNIFAANKVGRWLDNQITYCESSLDPTTMGVFVEIEKLGMQAVVDKIVSCERKEWRVHGGVGCGKSTKLPSMVSTFGHVLMLEPSRALAKGVCESIQATTGMQASLCMRNHIETGSAPITVMTYGYALAFFGYNPGLFEKYKFIQLDEVHEYSSEAIVWYNWMKPRCDNKVIYKTSATHKGFETAFNPKNHVEVEQIEKISPTDWAKRQGTGVKGDCTKLGRSALVIVASYSDVDKCAKELQTKNFSVIKVDRRSFRDAVNLTDKVKEAMNHDKYTFIVSTPITQTGVTLDIDVVVDFGEKIVPVIDNEMRMLTTQRKRINRSDRMQRLGRVGRTRKGWAIKVGSGVDGENDISEVVATESVLLAFVHGVKPCMYNVNVDIISDLTREQCTTASNFESSILYMAHYVLPDGCMLKSVYNQFKGILLREVSVRTWDQLPAGYSFDSWRSLSDYAYCGYLHDREIKSHRKIPFHSHEFSDKLACELADSFEEAKFKVQRTMSSIRLPSADPLETHHKLSLQEGSIATSVQTIEAEIQRFMEIQSHLSMGMTQVTGGSLLAISACGLRKLRERALQRVERNLIVLREAKARVEQAGVAQDNKMLLKFLEENPLACSVLQNQCSGKDPMEDILESGYISKYGKKAIGISVSLVLAWIMFRYFQKREDMCLQSQSGKGRRQIGRDRKLRDMGGPELYFVGKDEELYEAYGPDYVSSGKRDKIKKSVRDRYEKSDFKLQGIKNKRFIQLYDLELDDIERIWLYDPKTDQLAIGEGLEALKQAQATLKELNSKIAGGLDEEREKIAYVLVKDGVDGETKPGSIFSVPNVRKIKLTPHNSRVVSRFGPMPVGFPDKDGELRQTGGHELVPFHEVIEIIEGDMVAQSGSRSIKTLSTPQAQSLVKNMAFIRAGAYHIGGFFTGSKLIVNAHFGGPDQESARDDPMVVYTSRGVFQLPPISKVSITEMFAIDMVVVHLPFDMQPFKSCKNFRAPKEREQATIYYLERNCTGVVAKETKPTTVHVSKKDPKLWVHYQPMEDGMCGSLIVSLTDGKIIGFHSYKSISPPYAEKNIHYFVAVCPELIEGINKTAPDGPIWTFDDSLPDWSSGRLGSMPKIWEALRNLGEYVQPQCSVGNQFAGVRTSYTEKYCGGNLTLQARFKDNFCDRHVIKGHREDFRNYMKDCGREDLISTMAPSVLTREAFFKDLIKYDEPIMVGVADSECFYGSITRLVDHLIGCGFMVGGNKCIWNAGEIYNDLNLDAATGALYDGKKRHYLEGFSTEQLHELFIDSMTRLANGDLGIWTGSLKAELRPIEKVKQGKTRVFTAAPIDVLLGAKALVDSFNKQFYTTNVLGPWTVGINKFNGGWNRLARKFNHEWVFIDADGSRFDSSLAPVLFQAICSIREYFMDGDELERTALRNLYTQIVYTPITTVDGFVVKKHKGNNSGQPSTVVDNTMILVLSVEYARLKVEKDHGFKMEFDFVANGDDLLINLPRGEVPYVQKYFASYMKELGLNYDFSSVQETITSVDFLSHTFMEREGMFIPKLDKERILSILEWEKSNDFEAIVSSFNAALVEAYGYDDVTTYIKGYVELYKASHNVPDFKLLSDQQIHDLYHLDDNEALRQEIGDLKPFAYYYTQETDDILQPQSSGQSSAVVPPVPPQPNSSQGQIPLGISLQANTTVPPGPPLIPFTPPPNGQDIESSVVRPIQPPRINRQSGMYASNLKAFRGLISNNRAILAYRPIQQLIDNRVASVKEVERFITSVAQAYGVSEDEFSQTILPLFIWNCIDNGTSAERATEDRWRAVDNAAMMQESVTGDQAVVEYEMRPIIEASNKNLRRIMRFYSPIAMAMIKNVNQESVYIPKPGLKAGLRDKNYAHVCYDFCVEMNLTHTEMEIKNQVSAALLRGKTSRMFALAETGLNNDMDTERHVVDDVNARTHSYQGAHLT